MQVEPASITKLMTAYVVFSELAEGNITLEETVAISERAWRTGGSRMFIEPGYGGHVEDLIRGMVIQSGNDASVALAEHVAGSEEAFADLMNHYAELLGMDGYAFHELQPACRTRTITPHARDIAILSAATIRDFPSTIPGTRRRNSPSTASGSITATHCCGAIRPLMASRPGTPRQQVTAWRLQPSATACV